MWRFLPGFDQSCLGCRCCGAPPLRASTVKIGTCTIPGVTTVYTTIQSAVTAVSAGSTIDVCPGNYPENDGIDLCSNNNTAEGNIVDNSGESGIHLDSNCGATLKQNLSHRRGAEAQRSENSEAFLCVLAPLR